MKTIENIYFAPIRNGEYPRMPEGVLDPLDMSVWTANSLPANWEDSPPNEYFIGVNPRYRYAVVIDCTIDGERVRYSISDLEMRPGGRWHNIVDIFMTPER